MLTFHALLTTYGINPAEVRLVRHGNKEIPVLDVFQNNPDRLTNYTAWQRLGRYGDSRYIAVFAPARGTTALFLGLWAVDGVTVNKDLTPDHLSLLRQYELPEEWYERSAFYHLNLSDVMSDLSERLIIDWGGSTVSWVQRGDKPVVLIKGTNSIGDFVSYDQVQLSYPDLQKLIQDTDSNITWVNALTAVNGIYLIRHTIDGKLYVGSAYGKEGIFGRWKTYSRSGHGGNKFLKDITPQHMEFSILEVANGTMSADDVIERESRWKLRLGTRIHGLNDN